MDQTSPVIEIELSGGRVAEVRTAAAIGAVEYVVVDRDADGADDERTAHDANGDAYTIDGGTTEVEPFVTATGLR